MLNKHLSAIKPNPMCHNIYLLAYNPVELNMSCHITTTHNQTKSNISCHIKTCIHPNQINRSYHTNQISYNINISNPKCNVTTHLYTIAPNSQCVISHKHMPKPNSMKFHKTTLLTHNQTKSNMLCHRQSNTEKDNTHIQCGNHTKRHRRYEQC
uniref:Uncharacterized protein n=1 Tax=Arion vulgaris TaxID=1028688 RepID=A0A0B7B2D3_9EUPU